MPQILVVDDEPEAREMARRKLERCGYRVLMAKNGQQALEMVHRAPVDLILSDIVMDSMDGRQLYQELKRCSSLANIPVIMTSAYDQGAELRQSGVENFLAKPFDGETMIKEVRRLLDPSMRLVSYYRFLIQVGGDDGLKKSIDRLNANLSGLEIHTVMSAQELLAEAGRQSYHLIMVAMACDPSYTVQTVSGLARNLLN